MRARHRTSTGREPATDQGDQSAAGPTEGTAHRPTPDGSGIAEPTCTRGYRNRPDQDAAPPHDQADAAPPLIRAVIPAAHSETYLQVDELSTCQNDVSCLALGKTSARYGEQVPTPHYGQPRYRVIADELRERIESGAIAPGALLPAESTLTAEFRVARGTHPQGDRYVAGAGLCRHRAWQGHVCNPPKAEHC